MDEKQINDMFYVIEDCASKILEATHLLNDILNEAVVIINSNHPHAKYTLKKLHELIDKFPELSMNKIVVEG